MLISLSSTCEHLNENRASGGGSGKIYFFNYQVYCCILMYIYDVHMYIQEHDAPVTDPVGEA